MNRRKKRQLADLLKYVVIIGLLFFFGLFFLSLLVNYVADPSGPEWEETDPVPALNQQIWEYKPIVEKYAEEHGIEDQTNTILAMMMQESGGSGTDPMQSSESLCGERGCIDDPEHSIEQGVSFFAQAYEQAEGDTALAVQAYNFGPGFIDYVQESEESYSEDAAIAYSQYMYEEAGSEDSIYACRREEAEELDACYGDIYYVSSVMSYKEAIEMELEN
ncbi:lysozyme family protein [Oceanobacillus jeddahense]|uniref:Lysozyme family protein n=1 Tax=Oceanobacillus jeddahense TaxID=1462527 RepID=A0ABY5JR43_9BACI|nr:lysozyme family protein [Oceanobacillus jeddahense]UUI02714.1 lysozyme family protein [Oceanobacillus jeddahense]